MRFAHMTAEYVPQVAALEKVCFSDPWSEKSVASELENPLSCWMVALDGETVAVHPNFRRQGVARALILALTEELKNRGSRCLTLEVRASNIPARALYESLGFVLVGTRRNYYYNPKEDALILRKEWEI